MCAQFVPVEEAERGESGWLWPRRIPIGSLTILDGNPGAMKSTVLADLAARVTTGRSMPFPPPVHMDPEPGSVIICNAEDTPSRIRSQLQTAAADMSRIRIWQPSADGREVPLLPDAVADLEHAVVEQGNTRLIVIDPLSAFIRGGLEQRELGSNRTQPAGTAG